MESQGAEPGVSGNSKDVPHLDIQYLILSVPQSCSSFHCLAWKAQERFFFHFHLWLFLYYILLV